MCSAQLAESSSYLFPPSIVREAHRSLTASGRTDQHGIVALCRTVVTLPREAIKMLGYNVHVPGVSIEAQALDRSVDNEAHVFGPRCSSIHICSFPTRAGQRNMLSALPGLDRASPARKAR